MVNGRIYILDDQKQTISQYNISDGKFQKTIALDKESGIRSHRIQWADGSLFVIILVDEVDDKRMVCCGELIFRQQRVMVFI